MLQQVHLIQPELHSRPCSSPGFVQIPHRKAAAHSCHTAVHAHMQARSPPGLEQVPEPPAGAGRAHVEAVMLTNILEDTNKCEDLDARKSIKVRCRACSI